MAITIKIKRATRAQIDNAASNGHIVEGEPYLITDEKKLAVGVNANTFKVMAHDIQSEEWEDLSMSNYGQHRFTSAVEMIPEEAYSIRLTVQASGSSGTTRGVAQVIADVSVYYVEIGGQADYFYGDVNVVSVSGATIPNQFGVNPDDIIPNDENTLPITVDKSGGRLSFRITNNLIDNMQMRYRIQVVKHEVSSSFGGLS